MPPKFDPVQFEANLIATMKEEFAVMRGEMVALINKKDEEISVLRGRVTQLERRIEKLEDAVDDGEALGMKNHIILSGEKVPPFSQNEETSSVVRNVLRTFAKFELPEDQILSANRIGAKPTSQRPDTRNIRVVLRDNGMKHSLLSSCKSARPQIYMSEFLTPRRSTIMYVLRKIKKAHPSIMKGYSSYDGKVYAYTPRPTTGAAAASSARDLRTLVNSHRSLLRFCDEIIEVPLSTFLPVWPH